MADFRYHRQPPTLPLERRQNIFIFNVNLVLVDLSKQVTPSTFTIFSFVVSILLTFIQIKSQAPGILSFDSSSPFDTLYTKFMLAMFSLLGFSGFAVGANLNCFPSHTGKLRMAMKSTASISVASLVSILLPQPWDQVPYVMYVFYLVSQGICFVLNICLAYYYQNGFVHGLRAFHRRLRTTRTPLPGTLSGLSIPNYPVADHGSITEV